LGMSEEFVFEDEDGNEFVFEDEVNVKKGGATRSTTMPNFSSYSGSPASVTTDDDSSEEWIFEEDSDEETAPALTSSAPIVKSRANTSHSSPRFLKKFSSTFSQQEIRSNTKKSDLRNASWVEGEDLIDLPDVDSVPATTTTQTKEPTSSKAPARKPMSARDRAESTPVARAVKSPREGAALPQIKPIQPKETDEQADLADQIAALRIIASKGKDTKYLSIRGNSHAPASAPVQAVVVPGNSARDKIVAEIITTEETYVNDLEILIRLYLEPLSSRRNKKKKPILTPEQVKGLFSNIASILNLNRVLLADLQAQAALSPEEQRIGAAFNLLAKCLLIYTDYCSNQKNADDLYTKLKSSNDKFNALCAENVANPECRRLDLNAFLIKPVQRACKYPLLLRELLKETPETHPDYSDLKEAFEAMQESCLKLNERKRDVENMSHFLTIKARTGKNFIETGRTFVDDGHISIITEKTQKRSSKVKFRLRKGRYVLFSDMVVFISEGKVIAQVSLATGQIQEAKLAAHPLALLLVARASRLILLPNTQAEKDSISKLISQQIEQLRQRNSSRGLKKRAMPTRAARNRAADNSVTYNCTLGGNVRPVKIPINCQTLAPFKMRLQRAFALPAADFGVSFLTNEGTTVSVGNDQEYSQYLPFMKQIIITPK